MTTQRAAFLVSLVALAGANIAQVQSLLAAYFFTDQMPTTSLFKVVFVFIWLPLAALCAWCGLAGGYTALRDDRFDSGYLTAFVVLQSLMVKVDGVELGWMLYRLSFHIGWDRLAVGCNAVGVGAWIWLVKIRRRDAVSPAPLHPTAGTETSLL